ncbi:DUF4337 domain-containing protein [Pelomonas sp. KK5]|uniref:DUF4337 domain-containing protein n=1 Tax=Pelomonas sp. KK5 TaxID=1855730 RepID=UPI00097C2296|nr:DUF4337 domain-containing protein [Pelomonas sp. KK5]
MSGHGFHVHGPHDHEIEHVAQHGASDGFASKIAVMTAVLATIGAVFGYMGGLTQANAGLFKNDAAIHKTAASDQWNYYQSKSSKQNMAELAMDLTSNEEAKAKYKEKIARYEKEKAEIKLAAEKLEHESEEWNEKSDHQLHEHHRWAQATTALQVAIAMAAITLLTKKKWMEHLTIAAGLIGIGLGVAAWMHY